MIKPISSFRVDHLHVKIYNTRSEMGLSAAGETIRKIDDLLQKQSIVNIIFAAAPSQNEFLAALAKNREIDWTRVNAFHMDEYIGLEKDHPARFGNFLKKALFDKVPFNHVFYLNEDGEPAAGIIERYRQLLEEYPVDIVCMGIGENTHIAFNDPFIAKFGDPDSLKVVDLDEQSRLQQVHDGCFSDIGSVPVSAITLTVPALLRAKYIYCMVPSPNKAEAVFHTLNDEVSERYPSTVLRSHEHAVLFLDRESAVNLHIGV